MKKDPVNILIETVKRSKKDLNDFHHDNYHMILGMMGELGELSDALKKHLAYGREVDWVNVKEEVGDLLFYLIGFCLDNNLDLAEIAEMNSSKLKSRYPDGFSEKRATERDTTKEKKVMVSVRSSSGKKLPREEEKRLLEELGYR